MEFAVLGWPPDGPTLDLDHERFPYAGKFVMSDTGKAVAREGADLVAAVAFSPDRTDDETLRLRYVTVRADRRGEGIGPRLLRFVTDRALDRRFQTVIIAVNNPYAYEAAYRAGFGYTGEQTGMAELELVATFDDRADDDRADYDRADDDRADDDREDADRVDADRYEAGLAVFADRDLPPAAESFVARTRRTGPPTVCDGTLPASETDR